MTPSEFCYWLQGHLEIGGKAVKSLDAKQTKMIRDHLGYVFETMHKPTAPILTPQEIRDVIDGVEFDSTRRVMPVPGRLIC